jgi:hypothetical protein
VISAGDRDTYMAVDEARAMKNAIGDSSPHATNRPRRVMISARVTREAKP